MKTKIPVVISIGSNCGDRLYEVKYAGLSLSEILENIVASSIYETPAVGNASGPYMNCVIAGTCDINETQIDRWCKNYENRRGRDEHCKSAGKVPVDIDIVIYNEKIIREWDFKQDFFQRGYEEIKNLF